MAGGIEHVRIEQGDARGRVGIGAEHHQRRLLLGRVGIEREDSVAARVERAIGRRGGLDQPAELVMDRLAAGQIVEIAARPVVLRVARAPRYARARFRCAILFFRLLLF